MSGAWQSTMTLTPDQRLDVLNLLNRTETRLGREAIDEVHRRAVVHGWSAEHWLQHRAEQLEGYALLSGSTHPTIEMCGGGFDQDLLEAVLEQHDCVDWWERDMRHTT